MREGEIMKCWGRYTTLLAVLAFPSAAMSREAYEVKTPSGAAEAVFVGKSATDIKSTIASACLDIGWAVSANTDGMVICTHGNIDRTTVLLSPRRASFQGVVNFVIVQLGDRVRVQATDFIEITNAFGQTRSVKGTAQDDAQDLLIGAGGIYPPGTRLEGLDLGLSGYFSAYGFVIKSTKPDGSAAAAGIFPGDKIRKINGHSFDDLWWFRHKVNAVAPGSVIVFDVERGKERLKISVQAKAPDQPA